MVGPADCNPWPRHIRIPWDNRFWNLRVADWSVQMKNRDYSNPSLQINTFKPATRSALCER